MIEKVRDLSLPPLQENNVKKNDQVHFSDVVKGALDKVNEKQIAAEDETIKLVTGDEQDLSKVLLTTEEARLSLELAYQVRNKIVDAYQEISRMQI
ncbi:MAG TPA: flagellar hook-basal body complex protein FliE [Clostridiaceae bacterium]|jgi:flagellar hook-basal body complex protein FliE|nr:flagellar hook-basal body complex protein FliE [Clostridiaceae bacterium]HBF77393.1 flagellar hook-basal body complex protein FliE [Clostridiaceae bacterium]HBG39528.1 flagellar hook-basal body complex protein FliE [Clostridiaceae bacterium]HBN27674.1 flagellar hook-basal body complex protein FliE [Clostridiaceae bacterium]HBX49032.1 flagellar hook-basal body complex protein FliE [Clostridiaceae bacterium]